MTMHLPIITITTDFGNRDYFVASMKGRILSICENAILVDVTHDVERQNILHAAVILGAISQDFPKGAVHLAVVDPGVGSSRKPMILYADGNYYVGPDNGIFTCVLNQSREWKAWEITNTSLLSSIVSTTFHGRDIFAPAAAYVARGESVEKFCEPLSEVKRIVIPTPIHFPRHIVSHYLSSDHFGNVLFDLTLDEFIKWNMANAPVRIRIRDNVIEGISATYSDVPSGWPLAYFGSSGYLEIAVRESSAKEYFQLASGDSVVLEI
jgi:S-adenosylmethionine hydrolase